MVAMIASEVREALIRLSVAGARCDELLTLIGNTEEFERFLSRGSWTAISHIPPRLRDKVDKWMKRDLSRAFSLIERQCVQILVIGDDFYPEALALTERPPVVLYALGDLHLLENVSLSVVGARKHTDYGQRMCEKFVRSIAEAGVCIVSGLALGIDKIAHTAALDVDGKTIAVLGNGIGACYPASNRHTYERILKGGLVLSEYPPFTTPKPFRFPERNRIIAALADGVLVVEAKERSGSLITARLAGEMGKEVFSICGNLDSVYSKGTNALIRDGAQIVLDPKNILESAVYQGVRPLATPQREDLTLEEKEIYDSIKNGYQNAEALSEKTSLEIAEVLTLLTMLELKNYISGADGDSIEIIE
ncbi:DNA protecting protein DprA [Aedoeadaptatus ivorii]|uniref:DNA protecting protein DprA n=2 Tax=Aedoeadaptatus ivorii TaxID=54006 RepID=A0A3S5AJE8_9FIRM|nr:DNA protecting protein DprA [Peptoniphilus ivorii]